MWFGYVEPLEITNMDELRTEVQTKLKKFMSVPFLTIDNIWTSFKDILLSKSLGVSCLIWTNNVMYIVVICFPRETCSRSKQTYPWITTEVRKIINKKNKAGRKVRKTNNQKDRDRFRKLKAEAQKTARNWDGISSDVR
jgi:hypothetical protein